MRRDDPIQPHTNVQAGLSSALCLAASLIAMGALLSHATAASAQTTPAPAAHAKPAKAAKSKAAPKSADAPAAEAATKDPAAAQRNYDSGRAAYQAGKYDAAIQSMNAVIQVGGLEQRILANALLVRGASFQKSGKPGQAISDLTSAMWLKDGLSASERAEASQFRSQAYKDAGLSEQAANPAQSGTAPVAGTDTVVRNLETASTRTTTAAVPVPTLNALPSEGTSTPETGLSGASVGKFFSNIFSPSQSATSEPASQPPKATVSASPPPAALAAPPATNTGAEVLPWATATGTAPPAPEPAAPAVAAKPIPKTPPVKTASAKPAAPAVATAGQGTYRIQVAAVKSRDEASAVIAKLQGSGGVLATSPSAVDEMTFGSMGTFYRVRLGPFANAAATKVPCDSLKAKGFDCLVTTN